MATRTLKVEFVPEELLNEPTPDAQVHDISIDDSVQGTPEVLENPHTDFPGTWRYVGEGAAGAARYERVARVADTNDTVAL